MEANQVFKTIFAAPEHMIIYYIRIGSKYTQINLQNFEVVKALKKNFIKQRILSIGRIVQSRVTVSSIHRR